ncbi:MULTISPECIES: flavin-containing monooxygenase [Paenibacillus]|nr:MULTISPECIES: NAD(P)/FAD-dependent oxidoreductase [Paenibacillus]KGP77469.1 oxidoreductase [Paenibacillus sp. MAEPY2]KGP77535.1 oxidoreductase [Paenibacillus sp. MAEPY1]MDN4605843.1 NAD(P)/FAD-dependent oxidoreductase [Paenibacillus vandeheii]
MYDVLVIGAGQAGLATGYYLKQTGLNFMILDSAPSIGDSWRRRYESLHLFTPRMYDGLPGMLLNGDQNGLPSKDEIASYLESYANHMELPIMLKCLIKRLRKKDKHFIVESSNGGIMEARKIIVATGPFQVPNIPPFYKSFSDEIIQLHSSEYLNPEQLRPGNTVVVGGGNSGAQIAVELAKDQNRNNSIYISIAREIAFKPLYIMNRSIFWYFEKLGFLRAKTQSPVGRWLKNQTEQVYGYDLKRLIKSGEVCVAPRALNASGNYITFEDGTQIKVNNIIWATGFRRDDQWIDIHDAFNLHGQIQHTEGVSQVAGLYFVGLPWQSSRGSALLGWVKYDAQKIVSHLNATFN